MRILKSFLTVTVFLFVGCGSGGPVTPLQSFNMIKLAVEKKDSEAVTANLSGMSLKKIEQLKFLIKNMDGNQLELLSVRYGLSRERLLLLKTTDAVNLYFFSDATGVNIGRYFTEKIISIDIKGGSAVIKTDSGVELDFKREGPYWKFDISSL